MVGAESALHHSVVVAPTEFCSGGHVCARCLFPPSCVPEVRTHRGGVGATGETI